VTFRSWLAVPIVGALLAPAALPSTAEAATLNVMSYNINWGAPSGSRLDAVAKVIASSGADVAGLQQVRRYARVAKKGNFGCVDQPAKLAAALKRLTGDTWHWAYAANTSTRQSSKHCKSVTSHPRQEGVLIVSRYPMASKASYKLPYERGVAKAVVKVPGAGNVAVFTVHLDTGSAGRRTTQAKQVAGIVKGGGGTATFLTGDMNDQPGDAPIRALTSVVRDAWADKGAGAGATRNSRIDYVMYRGNAATESARVIQSWASDHRPVIARFTVK
jgi:endonuclease/exonuclease/phosphatase family metal-dependent hydrolase